MVRATVDDPVPDRLDRPAAVRELRQRWDVRGAVPALQGDRCGLIVAVQDRRLEAAGPGVDDEDAHVSPRWPSRPAPSRAPPACPRGAGRRTPRAPPASAGTTPSR